MMVVKSKKELRRMLGEERREGKTVGFVPTMGYLHEGHLSLVRKAREENDVVVVSIFVNPTQFGEGEDYRFYPRDLARDAELVRLAGADLVFAPDAEEMYAGESITFVDMDGLTNTLCGASRPGHFRGVMTVVTKLFNIVNPDRAYFGQKDAQQVLIIKRMVEDLDFGVEIIEMPIVRERDGLAMSSRNTYLKPEEREGARVISQALFKAAERVMQGESKGRRIRDMVIREISSQPIARIDYVEVVDALTLEPLEDINGNVLIAAAVRFGSTRLIDNVKLQN